jgi:hypothetical protein
VTGSERVRAWVVLLLATAAMLWPVLATPQRDSFPLSTYPMFAARRGNPVMHQVVAVDASGTEYRVAPEYLGSSEVLQAKSLLDAAARGSQKRRDQFCRGVAKRLQRGTEVQADHLEIVRLRFEPIAYFTTGPEPLERSVLSRCSADVPENGAP